MAKHQISTFFSGRLDHEMTQQYMVRKRTRSFL
uniref:Uncharacterized protein n=1 Tax=Anguilla anguilla TaxID=7936 RepID=A0A0E9VDZ7_ANGAN